MTDEEATAKVKRVCPEADYVSAVADRVVIHWPGGITFALLSGLSEAFGTKRIDVNCDLGCASDPGHDTTIVVWLKP